MPAEPRQPAATMRQRLARWLWLDDSVPEAVRRPMRWTLAAIGGTVLAFATILAIGRVDLAGVLAMALLGGFMIVMHSLPWFGRRAARHAIDRAAAHDHLLCPDCTYDLRTLDDAGTCPECGRAYEHDAVRAQWLDAERRLKRRKA